MLGGRFEKATSFLGKHSSTAEVEESTRVGREPNRRKRIGPCLDDNRIRAWWVGVFTRWRWPIMGRGNGPGGRRFLLGWMK